MRIAAQRLCNFKNRFQTLSQKCIKKRDSERAFWGNYFWSPVFRTASSHWIRSVSQNVILKENSWTISFDCHVYKQHPTPGGAPIFGAPIFAPISGIATAHFTAHFCAHFPPIFLRHFRTRPQVFSEPRENTQKMRAKMRKVPGGCHQRGCPTHLPQRSLQPLHRRPFHAFRSWNRR